MSKKLNWKSIIGWGIAALVAGFIVYSNMQEQERNAADKRHLVLVLAAQTGPASSLAKYLHQGYKLALQDIQKKYGDIIRLQIEDHGGNPQKAITDFRKNKRDNMSLIVEWSGPTKAISSQLDGTFLSLASGVSYPGIANPEKGLFRIYIDSESIMPEIVKQIQKKGMTKASVLSFDDDYGLGSRTSFKKAFEAIGGKIVSEEQFVINQLDIRNQVYKLLKQEPEVVFVTGYGQTYISLFKMLKEQGFKGLIIADWPLTCPEVYQPLGSDAEGIIVVAPRLKPELIKMYQDLYQKPGYLTNVAYGYDSLMLIAKAYHMIQSGQAKDMVSAMKKVKEYSGFSGNFQIKEDGNNTNDIIAYVIKNGEFIPIESEGN